MYQIKSSNVDFKCTPLGCCFSCLPGAVVYTITVSTNGVARFHLSADRQHSPSCPLTERWSNRWQLTRILFAYGDSACPG